MAVDPEIETLLRELFEPLDGVVFRRMFGGLGIFRHNLMFGLYSSQGHFALKADEITLDDFVKEGCVEWNPPMRARTKPIKMGYWQAPERLLEDQDELLKWAEKAFEAAIRRDSQKPLSQRKLKHLPEEF